MRARFVLLGTNHPLQLGAGQCSKEKITAFRDFLISICRSEQIQLIAEEASTDGLKKYSVAQTVGALAAAELHLPHKMVDLLSEERFALGICDAQLSKMAFDFQKEEEFDLGPLRSRLNDLSNQVREGTWIARSLLESVSPVLLIVGADHIQAVEELIGSVDQEVVIVDSDYDP